MKTTHDRMVYIFGIEVARIEETSEVEWSEGSERGGHGYRPKPLVIDPDFITPILADSLKSMSGPSLEKISFINGMPLEVPGNIDSDVACDVLRRINNLSKDQIMEISLGFAAQTDIWDPMNRGFVATLRNSIKDTIDAHWKNDAS